MKLRFTATAEAKLQEIRSYIEAENPGAARRVLSEIRSAAELLRCFPGIGRVGQDRRTREWLVRRRPYILVYRVLEARSEIVVVAVYHTSQDRPVE